MSNEETSRQAFAQGMEHGLAKGVELAIEQLAKHNICLSDGIADVFPEVQIRSDDRGKVLSLALEIRALHRDAPQHLKTNAQGLVGFADTQGMYEE